MSAQPVSSPHRWPVTPLSVIVTADAPGVFALIVGFQFMLPYVVHVSSWQILVCVNPALEGSIVPIDSDAKATILNPSIQNKPTAIARIDIHCFIRIDRAINTA